jgi:AcrR family transcriptional regulator
MSNDNSCEQILRAAGPIFAEKGFHKATVREICHAAGVNVAAINYHFGDKHQLYVKTVEAAHDNRSTVVPLPNFGELAAPTEKLRAFVHTITARMAGLDEAPWQTQLLMREVLSPTEACRSLIEDYFRPMMNVLLSIIDELVPAAVTANRRQMLAFSIVGQCVFYRAAGDVVSLMVTKEDLQENYSIRQLADHIADMAIASIENLPGRWLAEPTVQPADATLTHPTEVE